MTYSLGQIFNLALGACGSTYLVRSADERSPEAEVCRLWFPAVRDNVQSAAPWPSVKTSRRLARLSEAESLWDESQPGPGYAFAYAVPSNLLIPYHLDSFRPFAYSVSNEGERMISTNEETPILHYLQRNENIANWSSDLVLATAYTLSVHIARQLTGKASTIGENMQIASSMISDQRMRAANAADEPREVVPDHIQARGYAMTPQTRYYYPMQNVNFGAAT
jgi:hypothetical protein